MIPKIIHYCWFGGKPIPDNLKKYIDGWKEKLPDYEIKEWNESNFDLNNTIPYVKQAYEAKKFAFVSDYVRLWALKEYGGVYLDTDMEIVQSFDKLLENAKLVTGVESKELIITAFIACEKGEKHISEFLEEYKSRSFKIKDDKFDLTPINDKFTELLQRYGLKMENERQSLGDGVEIYPIDVFCGYDIENSHPLISDRTVTIHHFQMSWVELSFTQKIKYKYIVPFLTKLLGKDRYIAMKNKIKK